jgi:hypothetical protein
MDLVVDLPTQRVGRLKFLQQSIRDNDDPACLEHIKALIRFNATPDAILSCFASNRAGLQLYLKALRDSFGTIIEEKFLEPLPYVLDCLAKERGMEQIKKAIETLCKRDNTSQSLFFVTLLERFVDGVISQKEVETILGRLLFLQDQKLELFQTLPWQNFEKASKQVEEHVLGHFRRIAANHPELKEPPEALSEGCKQAIRLHDQNSYLLEVSSSLIVSEGTINHLLIRDLLAHVFLPRGKKRSFFEKSIRSTLLQLLENEKLRARFAESPIPEKDSVGDTLVREAQHINKGQPLSRADVNRALLVSLMAPWRQYHYGSCHTTSSLIVAKNLDLQWIVDDFEELLQKGGHVRPVNGVERFYPALATFYPFWSTLRLDQLPSDTKQMIIHELLESPNFIRAFAPYNISSKKEIRKILMAKETTTIRDYFQGKKLATNLYEESLRLVEADFQFVIPQVVENSIMGMNFQPMSSSNKYNPRQQKIFQIALLKTIQDFVPNLEAHIPRPPNTDVQREFFNWNGISLPQEYAVQFDDLQFVCTPPQNPPSDAGQVLLHVREGNTFRPIQDAVALGKILRERLSHVFDTNTQAQMKILSDEQLGRKFAGYFTTYLQSFQSLQQNPEPWKFNIAVQDLQPIWSAYFKESRRETIAINDVPNGMKELCDWARDNYRNLSPQSDLVIPLEIPGHACSLLIGPILRLAQKNHETMLQEKIEALQRLHAQKCPDTQQRLMTWAQFFPFKGKDKEFRAFRAALNKANDKPFGEWVQLFSEKIKEHLAKPSGPSLPSKEMTLALNAIKKMTPHELLASYKDYPQATLPSGLLLTEFCKQMNQIEEMVLECVAKEHPQLSKPLIIPFADQNKAYWIKNVPLRGFDCFVLSPFDGRWKIIGALEDFSAFEIPQRSIDRMTIFSKTAPLEAGARKKQLLLNTAALNTLETEFSETWAAYRKIKKPKEFLLTKELLSKKPLKEVRKALCDLPKEYRDLLLNMIRLRRKYQKTIAAIKAEQNPPVDPMAPLFSFSQKQRAAVTNLRSSSDEFLETLRLERLHSR